ncbi:MAG: hypothetical protein E7620_07575 [Ruminococcaceae bacterium]|nr:hypothetical protein [Oscillospiraceae bacterium]
MKLKASKLIAVLCVVATILTMIVPMTLSTAAATEVTETITFDANKTQRTSFSTTKQVWASETVTFTNDKASSSSPVADYSNPVRLYASSSVTIEAPGTITKIVIVSDGTAKYKTALQNSLTGAGLTYTTSGNNYTVTGVNAASVTMKMTAQARFKSVQVTYEVADTGACQHEGEKTTVSLTEATCTADGEHVFTCGDCGETVTEVLKSEGHKFVDNACTVCGTNEYLPATVEEALTLADGTKVMLTGVVVVFIDTPYDSGYKNISVTVQDPETEAELYLYRLSGNWEVGDVLTVKGAMGSYNGKKQLAQGGTAEKTGEVEVEVNPLEATISEALELEDGTLVLVNGIVSKINTAWNASYGNMSVTITDESGKTLYLYKLATKVGLGDEIAVTGKMYTYNNARQINAGATAEILKVGAVTEIAQMSVNAGADLSLLAHVTLAYGEKVEDYAVKFVHANGAEVLVTAFVEKNGKYVFALNKIAPQAMSDLITVTLVKGETAKDTVEYSVKTYAQAILNGEYDAALKTFVSDMLAYGAAAQKHTNYNLENLATNGVEGLACSTATPDASANVNAGVQNGTKVDGLGFTAVGVKFDTANYIYAKFTAASLEGITVTINGEAAEIVELENGVYAVYSEEILATAFGQTFTIVLNNGADYQTLTYSVNSYAFAKANTELGATLYRYGASALALLA